MDAWLFAAGVLLGWLVGWHHRARVGAHLPPPVVPDPPPPAPLPPPPAPVVIPDRLPHAYTCVLYAGDQVVSVRQTAALTPVIYRQRGRTPTEVYAYEGETPEGQHCFRRVSHGID